MKRQTSALPAATHASAGARWGPRPASALTCGTVSSNSSQAPCGSPRLAPTPLTIQVPTRELDDLAITTITTCGVAITTTVTVDPTATTGAEIDVLWCVLCVDADVNVDLDPPPVVPPLVSSPQPSCDSHR